MATILHIDEYTGKGQGYKTSNGKSPNTVYPKRVTTQPKLTVSGSSQQSAAVNASTAFVSIRPVGGAVYVALGANPTASATTKYLADGDVYDVHVDAGDKIAVINAT